ncbi:hypothetical protein ACFL2T_00690 [Elusimicrobiota bacterium]
MPQAPNKVVVFVDLLGFAKLTESFPIDTDKFLAQGRPFLGIDAWLQANQNPLVHAFSGFHDQIKWGLRSAELRHPLTSISFSDSAFIAADHAFEAVHFASYVLCSLMSRRIPVRIGIAFGSFVALRFKSDVLLDAGEHAAQFLGTSIVRAHATETCGIKGMRILLHSSIKPLLDDPTHNPNTKAAPLISSIKCDEDEARNDAGVQHEVNYWNLPRTKERETWRGLQDMWSQAPLKEHTHYEATANAINRMRVSAGHSPLQNLRRKTLPRL